MKKIICIVLSLIVVIALAACGNSGGSAPAASAPAPAPAPAASAPAPAPAPSGEVIIIKLAGAFNEGATHYYFFDQFCENVREYSNGTLEVVWGHGPEAIPANELAEAMVNDTVELVFCPCTYVVSHMPVLGGVRMAEPHEFRDSGGVEFINQLSESGLNARFLGRTNAHSPMVIATQKEIKSLDDFNGMTIRGTDAHMALLTSLGVGVVNMGMGDVYQALEKNVIDGTGCGITNIIDYSFQDVIKYLIIPGFYCSDSSLFCALGTWNKLDSVQQDALEKAALDWELDSAIFGLSEYENIIQGCIDAGVILNEFQGQIREDWLRTAYDAGWAALEAADPENAAKLRSFTLN